MKTLPIDHLAGNLNAASEASDVIFGEIGGKLVTIGILISVYGALNGYTLTGIRVPYAMALEDELPFSKQLTKLSKKFTVPYVPAIFQLAVACIMMSLGSFDFLTDMLIFVMWLFSLLIFIGVFTLSNRSDYCDSRCYFHFRYDDDDANEISIDRYRCYLDWYPSLLSKKEKTLRRVKYFNNR